ncbi:MAG: alpha-galactosidase [Lachnospiraceae bacterium]|nr:alpha-galactosidase [Lachnospiraceae bacterium]
MKTLKPEKITKDTCFDSFGKGQPLYGKQKGHLPAMGWNSWNAFGSSNTEALTKAMADRIIALGLDKLGYRYMVLDDGCYKPERVDGKLANEEEKFPSGFRALADYLHERGLLFGMYNDVGTNLCAGAAVGTCGHEEVDARSYIDWDVDFLKVDNCYYPFDNATFSRPGNARYVYAPIIRSIRIGAGKKTSAKEGKLTGKVAKRGRDGSVSGLGTFDGTGPKYSPLGVRSSELIFTVTSTKEQETTLTVEYATGKREGVGAWLQAAVNGSLVQDGFLPETAGEDAFANSDPIRIFLKKGTNVIRLMNHRRQENTLQSYARLLKYLRKYAPEKDILYSACEWGKTQPQNWGAKVCDSWRILNDITFRVGRDGDPGHGDWVSGYTNAVTSQYNKAVIMDSFAGLEKGWNDPDMLMVGMGGLNHHQTKTHFAMWCMMNAPLMLGLDLRRVERDDALYRIIANEALIGINQDPLGIQAKRLYCSLCETRPDTAYVRETDRVDILVKPLKDGRFAVSFINLSGKKQEGGYGISAGRIKKVFGEKVSLSGRYEVLDVWTGKTKQVKGEDFTASSLKPYENITRIYTPV